MADPITDIVAKPIKALASMAFKKIESEDLDSTIEQLGYQYCSIKDTLQKVDPSKERSGIKRLKLIQNELDGFFTELAATIGVQGEVMGSGGFTAKVCLFLSSPEQHVLRFKYVKKVNDLTSNLKSLASDIELCKNIPIDPTGNENWCTFSEDTSSFSITDRFIGRDTDKENIINLLFNYPIVAIVGIGGQGKTTLAKYVCQDDRVKGSFDKLLWVYVTPKSSVDEILKKIMTSATGKKPTYYDLEHLLLQVLQAINKKKCLLVLDNVYYVENLRGVSKELKKILKQGRFWRNEGKVLITTHSEAAKLTQTSKPYELHDLAEDDCWIFLRHYAIKQEEKKECGVEEIGKEIARMCPKMPLVLKTVGCYLADKDYKCQWERFRNELASIPTLYIEQQQKIKQILKLCYDQLDHNLKCCAAFCSFFPKGHVYYKNYMVCNWIAFGFLESRDGKSLEDVGDAYVLELTQRGFFEEAGTFQFFTMHDVMHDLMRLIGKDEHKMIDSKTKNIVEGVRHISMNAQDLNWEVLLSSTSGKQKLEPIIMVSPDWDNRVHGEPLGANIDQLIHPRQELKILEVYNQKIEEVPGSKGMFTSVGHIDLSHLHFCNLPNALSEIVGLLTLNLSWCLNLQELPREMGKLVNLFSLNLTACSNLKELPRDIGKLVKLRFLGLKGCNLRYMPKGFRNLTKLEILDVFVVGESSRSSGGSEANEGGAELEELGHINHLRSELCLKLAGQSKDIVSEVGEAQLDKKTKLSSFKIEFKKKGEEDEKFLEGIHLCGERLKELSIKNYGGKRLPAWMVDDRFHESFPKLHSLVLSRRSEKNSQNKFFPKLNDESIRFTVQGNEDDLGDWVPRYSRIKEQLKIGNIELSFIARKTDGPRLADVRDLTLHKVCFSIEKELVTRSGEIREQSLIQSCFPNLTKLELREIPELEVLPEEFLGLTSLEFLIIDDCPNLKEIPDWIDTFSSLKRLTFDGTRKLKVLPDSICSLTSLVLISLWDCKGLTFPNHQLRNLHCSLEIH